MKSFCPIDSAFLFIWMMSLGNLGNFFFFLYGYSAEVFSIALAAFKAKLQSSALLITFSITLAGATLFCPTWHLIIYNLIYAFFHLIFR